MGRRKTPQEKKKNAYKKDVISIEEYPKSKAIGRARAKKNANKAYRIKVKSLLSNPSDPEELENKGVSKIRRKRIWKTQVVPLGEAIREKLEKRRHRLATSHFKGEYSSRLDRETFIAFLQPILAGRTEESYELSLVFREYLTGELVWDTKNASDRNWVLEGRTWLRAFFKDAPEWEGKLRGWIDAMVSEFEEKS